MKRRDADSGRGDLFDLLRSLAVLTAFVLMVIAVWNDEWPEATFQLLFLWFLVWDGDQERRS